MPARRVLIQSQLGLNLLMASLSVFFLAAIVAFLLVARRLPQPAAMPPSLWEATLCLIGISAAIILSERSARRERLRPLRLWFTVAMVLAAVFTVVQFIAVSDLYTRHVRLGTVSPAWIFLLLLVMLHAAHVLVGLVVLAVIGRDVWSGRYDHEYHLGLTLAGRYWHFLGLVWLAVLAAGGFLLR